MHKVNKLNFENLSPFRKNPQKPSSGSKTLRENDDRKQILKSARGNQENKLQQSQQFSHNILNQSTRINSSQNSNVTPVKSKKNHNYRNSQDINCNEHSKTLENMSPRELKEFKQQQQSYQKYSPMILRQSMKQDRINQSNQNINPKDSQERPHEDIKKLKAELENQKQREMKYLVKIANLEKENQSITEKLIRSEQENILLKNELQNKKRSKTLLIQNELNFMGGVKTQDVGVQAQMNGKQEQQIQILEEYTRLLKKKLKEAEKGSQHNQNNSYDKKQSIQKVKSGVGLGESELELAKIGTQYEILKNKYKNTLEQLFYVQKEALEMKNESCFLKNYINDKYNSFNSKSTCSNDSRGNYSIKSGGRSFEEFEEVPSIVKTLNLTMSLK